MCIWHTNTNSHMQYILGKTFLYLKFQTKESFNRSEDSLMWLAALMEPKWKLWLQVSMNMSMLTAKEFIALILCHEFTLILDIEVYMFYFLL